MLVLGHTYGWQVPERLLKGCCNFIATTCDCTAINQKLEKTWRLKNWSLAMGYINHTYSGTSHIFGDNLSCRLSSPSQLSGLRKVYRTCIDTSAKSVLWEVQIKGWKKFYRSGSTSAQDKQEALVEINTSTAYCELEPCTSNWTLLVSFTCYIYPALWNLSSHMQIGSLTCYNLLILLSGHMHIK